MSATPFTSRLEFVRNPEGVLQAIKLHNVRLSYPKLFKPEADRNNPSAVPKFGAVFIANLSDAEKGELAKFLKEASAEAFKKMLPADKYFAKNGDLSGKPEYAGCTTFSASEGEKNPPKVYNRHGILTKSEIEVYSGCMVTAVIKPWIQSNTFGQRINASLLGVKFAGDNEPFGPPPVDVATMLGCDPNQADPIDSVIPGFTPFASNDDDSSLPF
ncbi:MAG: DUF2815 family protein [Rhizobiales bacterium]|nr:DUF2815 family protein [Hyphomicrobiales bacterium]